MRHDCYCNCAITSLKHKKKQRGEGYASRNTRRDCNRGEQVQRVTPYRSPPLNLDTFYAQISRLLSYKWK